MLVGLDDTDSLAGGCTTHALFALLEAVPDLALAGPPRLVRLNPNNPRKTRGNGAVAFTLVEPRGAAQTVGCWQDRPILAYPHGAPAAATTERLDTLWSAAQRVAEPDAGSGLVAGDLAPGPEAYWQAVRGRVERPDEEGLAHRSRGDRWGLVGARAALAWPGPPSSFELIAYRDPARVGTPRTVASAALAALDGATTFHTFDAEAGRLACVPHTPCPVLAGLRGRDAERLLRTGLPALRAAAEPFDSWLLWASNQASGDHVTPVARLAQAPEWATVEVEAVVSGAPERRVGGHLFVPCRDAAGDAFTAAAFEPTKRFRDTVGALRHGCDGGGRDLAGCSARTRPGLARGPGGGAAPSAPARRLGRPTPSHSRLTVRLSKSAVVTSRRKRPTAPLRAWPGGSWYSSTFAAPS